MTLIELNNSIWPSVTLLFVKLNSIEFNMTFIDAIIRKIEFNWILMITNAHTTAWIQEIHKHTLSSLNQIRPCSYSERSLIRHRWHDTIIILTLERLTSTIDVRSALYLMIVSITFHFPSTLLSHLGRLH